MNTQTKEMLCSGDCKYSYYVGFIFVLLANSRIAFDYCFKFQ